jgi:hypothetical protein
MTVGRLSGREGWDVIVANGAIDVHQHLWPEEFIGALRRRTEPPYLVGWTLFTQGEPPYEVDAAAHDVAARAARETDRDLVLVSLSSPLGIEELKPDDAVPLLDAWHAGARRLGAPFGAWASVNHVAPDLGGLAALLADGDADAGADAGQDQADSAGLDATSQAGAAARRGDAGAFVGLQIPATRMATPQALEDLAEVLRVCELADRPVLVHPGAVARQGAAGALPGWWPAMVDYPAQMQAAWWAWHAVGRTLLPELRICFAAGAGLAPAHDERFVARAGSVPRVDPGVFVDTSSYGRRGLGALIQALGVDVVVFGTDRPYAEPTDPDLGAAATRAIRVANPRRLLEGGRP